MFCEYIKLWRFFKLYQCITLPDSNLRGGLSENTCGGMQNLRYRKVTRYNTRYRLPPPLFFFCGSCIRVQCGTNTYPQKYTVVSGFLGAILHLCAGFAWSSRRTAVVNQSLYATTVWWEWWEPSSLNCTSPAGRLEQAQLLRVLWTRAAYFKWKVFWPTVPSAFTLIPHLNR